MRRGAMLEQVHALPGTERHPAVLDGDGKLGEGERRAYVGRHVVRPLQRVTVEPAVLGHQAVEEGVQVVYHVRVGVLLNGERGGGMLHEDSEQTGAHPGALQPGGDLAGDFVQAFAAGGDLQAVGSHLHGITRWATAPSRSRLRLTCRDSNPSRDREGAVATYAP